MLKIISVYILVIYLIPSMYIARSEFLVEFAQVATIVLAFFVGSISYKGLAESHKVACHSNRFIADKRFLYALLIVYIIVRIGLISDVMVHLKNGNYAEWALTNALERYEFNEDPGLIWKIGTIAFVSYAIALGSIEIKRKNLYLFIGLVLMMFIESSQLARATTLVALAGLTVEKVIRQNSKLQHVTYPKLLAVGLALSLIVLTVFFYSAYMRVAHQDYVFDILLDKFSTYTVAMYEALFIWMSTESQYLNGYGYYTFTSLYKIFGVEVPQGFYLLTNTSYGPTNIYTVLRGFLQDFGLIGTCLLYFVFGWSTTKYTYKRINAFKYLILRTSLILVVYIIYSPFLFFTVAVGFLISYLMCVWPELKKVAKRSARMRRNNFQKISSQTIKSGSPLNVFVDTSNS